MAITNFVKRIQDVMRNDAGVNGDAQRIEQIVWTLFLKIYDAKEEEWELINDDYTSIIPDEFKWRNWAVDNKDGQLMRPLRHLHRLHLSAPRPIKQVFIRKGASHIPHRFGQHPAVFHLTERRGTNLAGKLRGKIVRVRTRPLYIDLIGQGALHGILLRNGRAAVGPA